MNLPLITEEQSESLKKLGFDRFEYQVPILIPVPGTIEHYPPVTVSLALQWLREERGVFLGIVARVGNDDNKFLSLSVRIWTILKDKTFKLILRAYDFGDYDLAESEGLDMIINHLSTGT